MRVRPRLFVRAQLVFLIFAFIAAILGIVFTPLFFAFHLLDMVRNTSHVCCSAACLLPWLLLLAAESC